MTTAREKTFNGFTHTQKRIYMTLRRYWRFDSGSSWAGFKTLARVINRPLNETVTATRSLREIGVLWYGPLTTDEGIPQGSGYILEMKWDY